MADRDQPSSTAKKSKIGRIVKLFWDVIKRHNSSRARSNSTRVSVSSALGAHNPVPGNDAGSAELTASSKYIGSILSQYYRRRLGVSIDGIAPDLLGSAVGQGELQSLSLKD